MLVAEVLAPPLDDGLRDGFSGRYARCLPAIQRREERVLDEHVCHLASVGRRRMR